MQQIVSSLVFASPEPRPLVELSPWIDCRFALSVEETRKHIDEGTIRDGMIPKIECCISALCGGVASAHVVDGRVLHAILLEIFTDGGVGTLLTR